MRKFPSYISRTWKNLAWTEWVPLHPGHGGISTLPRKPGVYRVRPVGGDILLYIGQTRRTIRQRARELAKCYEDTMPFNDPHTAAPHLWCLRVEDGMDFEISGAPLEGSREDLRAVEDYLLWSYRVEKGESTVCNHGRFHPRYDRPRNRKTGKMGTRLPEGDENPNSGESFPPLTLKGSPDSHDWMGLEWSDFIPFALLDFSLVPETPGVYRILAKGSPILAYIGEATNLRKRLKQHTRSRWKGYLVSFAKLPDVEKEYQLREIETDLLGAHFYQTKRPPTCQYKANRT